MDARQREWRRVFRPENPNRNQVTALYGYEMLRFDGRGEQPDAAVLGLGAEGVRFARR